MQSRPVAALGYLQLRVLADLLLVPTPRACSCSCAAMGQSLSEQIAESNARAATLLRDAQALIDCYPESEVSAAQKESCFKVLEENPVDSFPIFTMPTRARWTGATQDHDMKLYWIRTHILTRPLKNPNIQHQYRGRAEWPKKPAPVVVGAPPPSAASGAAADDSEDVLPQLVDGFQADASDECDALLAKKEHSSDAAAPAALVHRSAPDDDV